MEPRERLEREGEVGKGKKRGKGEEEAVKITTSPSSAGRFREGDFRRENGEFYRYRNWNC